MALEATQIDCRGCGAKLDIHLPARVHVQLSVRQSQHTYNTVYGPTMTVAVYTDATDSTPIWVAVGVMLVFLFVYVMVRAEHFFS